MAYSKLPVSADTYIVNLPGGARGSEVQLRFGGVSNAEAVMLLKFDLSSLPTNIIVHDARVVLTTVDGITPAMTKNFYRLVRDWTQANATWTAATASDNWGTAGAKNTSTDYNSTVLGTITHSTVTADPVQSTGLASTVQGWIDGDYSNYGLRFDGEAVSQVREWHSDEGATAAYDPYLEVWYTRVSSGYSVNSNTITGGIRAFWPPMQTGMNGDGSPNYSAWYRHLWTISELEMADYLTLQALRGTAISEVTTTDKDTPNTLTQYTTGNVLSVSGQQQGRRVLNVRVEFLLDTS